MRMTGLVLIEWSDSAGATCKARLPRYAAYELAEGLLLRCAIQKVTLDLGNRKTVATADKLGINGVCWVDPVSAPCT